jgi:hypothetical protein
VRRALLIYLGCLILMPAVRHAFGLYTQQQRKRWEEEEGLV